MVIGESSIHNIMGGMESTGSVRLHNHKRKLKQRFDIIKKLGQGTYGKVQLGINKETGQEVAIKTIKKCKIETEADLIRIRREIQIMSSVQHPNIIHIYEVFENREKIVLVMEYAAGGELYDYLSKRKVLIENEARRIFRQIVTAVFYCHKHNICHRDLKLENILLDQIGNAKIADFGLSNVFDGQRLLSTFCGSPLYASPEIVRGAPYHGPEVDCWSLGVLLYTLVYGAMPFDGSNFKRLVKQISQSDYFEPKVPSPASTLIKDMLTVCPTRRANIDKICSHRWVNEGYERSCLCIAEDLAAQTPVRLDLLLSLTPQSANAEQLFVSGYATDSNLIVNTTPENILPTRSYSDSNFIAFPCNTNENSREVPETESKTTLNGDSMNKNIVLGVKEKELLRLKVANDKNESEKYQPASSYHYASESNPVTENIMDIDLSNIVAVSGNEITETEGDGSLNIINGSKGKLENEGSKKSLDPSQDGEISENISSDRKKDVLFEKNQISLQMQKSNNESIIPTTKEADKINAPTLVTKSQIYSPNKQEKLVKPGNSRTDSVIQITKPVKSVKKSKDRSLSMIDDANSGAMKSVSRPVERRQSKIFETKEKFNQIASNVESEKPKKIFIPGVNVGGAKRAFERKVILNSRTVSQPSKLKNTKVLEKLSKTDLDKLNNDDDESKKKAIETITGAIGKKSSSNELISELNLTRQVGLNDVQSSTIPVSSPKGVKFTEKTENILQPKLIAGTLHPQKQGNSSSEQGRKSSKMEITLQTASSANTRQSGVVLKSPNSPENNTFKTKVEARVDVPDSQQIQNQRSEVALPNVLTLDTSVSCVHENKSPINSKERIVPIQVDLAYESSEQMTTPPHCSSSPYSESQSLYSNVYSDTDSVSTPTIGLEPIRKSPREYIIPIAVEGGNYVTSRSDITELESKNNTPSLSSASLSKTKFRRPRRMSSLLSDASEEDESPFLRLSSGSDHLMQRHMHCLRSSRPSRQSLDLMDSLSSGDDDDDDGFELLTAENLFSTLLSRVRSLTQKLNVQENKPNVFSNYRLLDRFGANSSEAFLNMHEPLSRRISESAFKRSSFRDLDIFSHKNSPLEVVGTNAQDHQRSVEGFSKGNLNNSRSHTLPRGSSSSIRQ